MAQKKITDLQTIASIDGSEYFPVDDTIQTYKATLTQVKNWIQAQFAGLFVPTAGVISYAGTSAPTGFLLCNGAAVSRTTYAALYAIIGTTHGQGDGSTTFNLPDYRGRFLRGVDGGQGRDPDASGRTAMNTGGNTGDNVGSLQGNAFQTHTHIQDAHTHTQNAHQHGVQFAYTNDGGGNQFRSGASATGTGYSDNAIATNQNTTATNQNAAATGTHAQATANETRPVNAGVNFIIKT